MTDRILLSVNVVYIDYYILSAAASYLEPTDGPIPVIRIFGSTPAGQQALVHIHGIYPYLYFRPENCQDTTFDEEAQVNEYLPSFRKRLEDELTHRRMKANENNTNSFRHAKRHVHKLEVVWKRPMYGYFLEDKLFVKVYLRDPGDMKATVQLLESGIFGSVMQPYEAHVPYLLKATMDYNIPPMGWMDIDDNIKFRLPLPCKGPEMPSGSAAAGSDTHPQALFAILQSPTLSSPAVNLLMDDHWSPLPVSRQPGDDVSNDKSSTTTTQLGQISLGEDHMQEQEVVTPGDAGFVFTQSTTPRHLVWAVDSRDIDDDSLVPQCVNFSTSPNGVTLLDPCVLDCEDTTIDNDHIMCKADIQALLDGITPEMLMRTQEARKLQSSHTLCNQEALVNASGRKTEAIPSVPGADTEHVHHTQALDKISTCELELDVHVSHIINQHKPRSRFGEELWEEEACRRSKRDLPAEDFVEPPFSTLRHRDCSASELEYATRLDNLIAKGAALSEATGLTMSSSVNGQIDVDQYLSSAGFSQFGAHSQHEETMREWLTQQDNLAHAQAACDRKLTQQLVSPFVVPYVPAVVTEAILGDEEHFNDGDDDEDEDEIIEGFAHPGTLAALKVREQLRSQQLTQELEDIQSSCDQPSTHHISSVKINKLVNCGVLSQDDDAAKDSALHNTLMSLMEFSPSRSKHAKQDNEDIPIVATSSKLPQMASALELDTRFESPALNSVLRAPPNVAMTDEVASGRKRLVPEQKKMASAFAKKKPCGGRPSVRFVLPAEAQDYDRLVSKDNKNSSDNERSTRAAVPATVVNARDLRDANTSSDMRYVVINRAALPLTIDLVDSPVPAVKSPEVIDVTTPEDDNIVRNIPKSSNLHHSSSSGCLVRVQKKTVVHHHEMINDDDEDNEHELAVNNIVNLKRMRRAAGLQQATFLIASGPRPPRPAVMSACCPPPACRLHMSNVEDWQEMQTAFPSLCDEILKNRQCDIIDSHKITQFDTRAVSSSLTSWRSPPCTLETIIKIYQSEGNDSHAVSPKFNSRQARCLQPAFKPPRPISIYSKFMHSEDNRSNGHDQIMHATPEDSTTNMATATQIKTPTPTNACIPRSNRKAMNREIQSTNSSKSSRLKILSVEIFVTGRGNLLPNPKFDAIQLITWSVDDVVSNAENENVRRHHGIVYVVQQPLLGHQQSNQPGNATNAAQLGQRAKQQFIQLKSCRLLANTNIQVVASEIELFSLFARQVRSIDPDILLGYEVQKTSLGYLVDRGTVIGVNVLQQLSRVPTETPSKRNEYDDYASDHESGIYVTGRIVLNIWRRMTEELKLTSYTFNNVAAHLLNRSVPLFTNEQLSTWFKTQKTRHIALQYMQMRSELNLLLIIKLDLVRRTAESARLYGIDFFSVITRGSQYRVEAVMLVKAHAQGFIAISPSKIQVANQAAMACIPLVMEPESRFYDDPVVVLDFQSLYPSMIIAYNLCYTTCIGKIVPGTSGACDTTERLGAVNYPEAWTASAAHRNTLISSADTTTMNSSYIPSQISSPAKARQLSSSAAAGLHCYDLEGNVPYISPNGTAFCTKSMRLGVLPLMLKEVLDTRVMIKKAMRGYTGDANDVLRRVLDARQLAIKMLANVTYGYASAGFSGRMPMAELADAVVQSGRSTLEWTIKQIESNPKWGGKVVYGDTDSVFIHLPGRTKQEAFATGKEIADYITKKSPPEVILKFEKVYDPCVLVTKKRYVGNSFETVDQLVSHFDAKGIEVVRRDQCPATAKIQEKVLRTLFATRDLSQVKRYLVSQWSRILQGGDKISVSDYIFRKEVRFGRYGPTSQPPGQIVTCKALAQDDMAEPPYKWRVPYLVVCGSPKAALSELVVSPEEFLRRGGELRMNSTYYITKNINPALTRVLSLCGADVALWYRRMIKPVARVRHVSYEASSSNHISGGAGGGVTVGSFASASLRGRAQGLLQQSMDSFMQGSCSVCGQFSDRQRNLCKTCVKDLQMAHTIVSSRAAAVGRQEHVLQQLCHQCAGHNQHAQLFARGEILGPQCCVSVDCKVFHKRYRLVLQSEDMCLALSKMNMDRK